MVWTPQKIALIARGRYDEGLLAVQAWPGMSLVLNSSGQPIPNNVIGGGGPLLVAIEDALRGGDITQALPISTNSPYYRPAKGDLFAMLLQNGQNVAAQTALMSAGDGTLIANPGPRPYQIVAPSAALNTYTSITVFSNGTFTLPANLLAPGDILHIRAKLTQISVTATPTNILTLKIGSTVIGATAAVSVIANDVIEMEAYLTIRTTGSGGTFIGSVTTSQSASGVFSDSATTLATTAINTTTTQAITANTTCSASSASNSCQLDEFYIEIIKAGGMNTLVIAQEAINNSGGTGTSGFNTAAFIRCMVP